MKNASAFITAILFTILGCDCIFAQPLNEDIEKLLPSRYVYDLSVTSVQDGPLIENAPIEVSYSLSVSAFHLKGPLPTARQGLICGVEQDNCKPIGVLREGRRLTGTITTTATAGAQAPLQIVLVSPPICATGVECFGMDPLAETRALRPVAARYSVTLDKFEIQHTRARRNDSLVAYLRAYVDGQRSAKDDRCEIYKGQYCVDSKLGDFNNGSDPKSWPLENLRVGTYDIVPETDGDLKISFALVNSGYSDNEAGYKETMDTINNAAGTVMQTTYGSQWAAVQAFTGLLNEMITPNCDGPTFVGAKTFLNRGVSSSTDNTLDSLTRQRGQVNIEEPVQTVTSQRFCGASSRYKVWWSIRRDSWKLPKEFRQF